MHPWGTDWMTAGSAQILDTTRGLDLPTELTIEEIVAWGGHIFLKTREFGILVREGDRTYRMKLTPFNPKGVKTPDAPESTPEPPPDPVS